MFTVVTENDHWRKRGTPPKELCCSTAVIQWTRRGRGGGVRSDVLRGGMFGASGVELNSWPPCRSPRQAGSFIHKIGPPTRIPT